MRADDEPPRGHRPHEHRAGLDLGPFVAAARRELDGAVGRQRLAGIPPAPSLPPRGRHPGLLVAAAVVLIGAAAIAAVSGDLLSLGLRTPASEAEHQAEPSRPALVSPRSTGSGRAEPEVFEVETPPIETAQLEDARAPREADDAPALAEPEDVVVEPKARPTRSSLHAELQRLDTLAQRRWRAGDLEGAEALFLEIVDKGGRTRYAELAFGDLFTLANQVGDARAEHQRWRRYLARFPRGRFADDVRAWQCRRASEGDALACWQRYLDDWPRGTYRAEAKRVRELGGAH